MSEFFMLLKRYALTQKRNVVLRDQQQTLTYQELWEAIQQNRKLASAKGLTKGMKAVFVLDSDLNWVIQFLTLVSLGVRVIPLSPEISAQELHRVQKELQPEFVIDHTGYRTIVSSPRPVLLEEPAWVTDEDEVLLHQTSGSTGSPRYCVRTLKGLTAEGISYRETLGLTAEDRLLNALPLHHSYALGMALMGALVSGSSLLLLPRFKPREYLAALQSEQTTVSLMVPVMGRLLVNLFNPEPVKLPELRVLMVGAGKISQAIFDEFYCRYGIWLSSNYGSTETGGVVSRLEPDGFPGAGKAMAGNEVMICDEEGRSLPPQTEGHVWVRTCGKLSHYWGESQEFAENEFFPMGDLGYIDEKGLLFLTGRVKSLINVGGKKVNPAYVEEILLGHPKVKDVAVVGVVRSSGEEMVKAVVVVDEEATSAELSAYCRGHLADHEQPTMISFVRKLPRNELGKLKKEELLSI